MRFYRSNDRTNSDQPLKEERIKEVRKGCERVGSREWTFTGRWAPVPAQPWSKILSPQLKKLDNFPHVDLGIALSSPLSSKNAHNLIHIEYHRAWMHPSQRVLAEPQPLNDFPYFEVV